MVDVVSITALVVSLVALVTTILQVSQQFLGSAKGYQRCARSVMGRWNDGTRRTFRALELSFEVIFETPVIFLCPPDNKKGPILEKEIYYIDGTKESYESTWTLDQGEEKREALDNYRRVHTADDERASWVTILSDLQALERQSREWERGNAITARGITYEKKDYTCTVALQRKTRSWEFMPSGVYKPFATTTICHLVELVTMLGMHWKEFDQKAWHMRAEGNGYILTSIFIQGLGIMVTFSKTGLFRCQENRYIPANEIKELSFGSVPSIFADAKPDLKLLNVGSDEEVNNTLQLLGCSYNTIMKYQKKRTHIFPLAFEIIGMLALPVRFRGSNFRMLPNPTTDHYPSTSFSRCKLMTHFQSKLSSLIDELTNSSTTSSESTDRDSNITSVEKTDDTFQQLTSIVKQWKSMKQYYPNDKDDDPDANIDIDFREATHDAIDQSTAFLSNSVDSVRSVISAHLSIVLEYLDVKNLDTALQDFFGAKSREEILLDSYFDDILPAVVKMGVEGVGEGVEARYAVWCTLVFRMICWLMLHDFDKADVKIVPSEFKGSRMPVYIG